jgi:hypothetical protein
MNACKRVLSAVLLLVGVVGLAGPVAADDEGMRTGVVQEVDREAGIVVINDRSYRYDGQRVQPPPNVSPESENHRTRAFERGMIVRYTVKPGDPPGIQQAWSVD